MIAFLTCFMNLVITSCSLRTHRCPDLGFAPADPKGHRILREGSIARCAAVQSDWIDADLVPVDPQSWRPPPGDAEREAKAGASPGPRRDSTSVRPLLCRRSTTGRPRPSAHGRSRCIRYCRSYLPGTPAASRLASSPGLRCKLPGVGATWVWVRLGYRCSRQQWCAIWRVTGVSPGVEFVRQDFGFERISQGGAMAGE